MTKALAGEGASPQSDNLSARLKKTGLSAIRGDSMSIKDVNWFWEPYIPKGMITLLQGDPEAGKSWICGNLAACTTTGAAYPLEEKSRPPANVIMLNSEDAVQETQLPRLVWMGADMKRVFLTQKGFTISRATLPQLYDFVDATEAQLLTIDPVQSWIGSGVDMNKANDVRAWGDLLGQLAEDKKLAVLVVGHLRKSKKSDGDDNPLYRGLGSIDFVGKARSVLHANSDPSGIRTLQHVKASVGHKGTALEYKLERVPKGASPFRWLGAAKSGLYSASSTLSDTTAACIEWLREVLAEKMLTAGEIKLLAANHPLAFSEATLKAAKKVAVESIRVGNDSYWKLKKNEND
jgi:hypothetical protein